MAHPEGLPPPRAPKMPAGFEKAICKARASLTLTRPAGVYICRLSAARLSLRRTVSCRIQISIFGKWRLVGSLNANTPESLEILYLLVCE